jgi:tripartite-type tricarboxylate transporter receptor subunit TctC
MFGLKSAALAGVFTAFINLHALAQPSKSAPKGNAPDGLQGYPNKPIRMIVPYPPGAGTDFTAREMGKAINEALGQPVVTDHRPGAAATLGHGLVAKAAPDGYTLGLATTGGMVSGPALLGNRIPYDPLKDFTHIGLATYVYYCVFVNAGLPANNMKEFIALAKAQNGKMNYSSPGVGTPNHIGGAQLVTLAGINLLHVPYKGSALSMADLIAGTIHMTITGFTGTLPHVKSGRLRVIAVGHTERIKMMPELPTVAETVPGYYNTGWWGLIAPPGLPKPIVDKLNAIINKYLNAPEIQQRFFVTGLEVATSTPQGYTDLIRSDLNAWRKLIKAANISVESLP